MSERYVGKLCRKGMSEEIPEGMSDGMSEVWGRWVRAGYLAVTLRMLAARTKAQGLTQDPRPPRTEPSHNALHHADRALSRAENGAQGMSEVCRKCVGTWTLGLTSVPGLEPRIGL